MLTILYYTECWPLQGFLLWAFSASSRFCWMELREHSTDGGSGGIGCDCTWPPSRPGPSTCPPNQMGWCPPADQPDHEWSKSKRGPSVGRQLLFSWFILLHVWMVACIHVCAISIDVGEAIGSPWIRIIGGCETPYRCWELNLRPLQEGKVS